MNEIRVHALFSKPWLEFRCKFFLFIKAWAREKSLFYFYSISISGYPSADGQMTLVQKGVRN